METVKYHYAYNEEQSIINIQDVSLECRLKHTFYCISCGADMIAKLGSKNTHHFAHKRDHKSCHPETYLHKLGKLLFKQRFEQSPQFEIEYLREMKCQKHLSCPFYTQQCSEDIYETFDLKSYFDTCSEEQTFDNYRADLLISDSSGKHQDVIFIEIYVTHKSTEKKQHSGHRIIEVQVKSDDKLSSLIYAPTIKENEHIKFFGFNRTSKIKKILVKRHLFRFYLFQSGSAYVSNFEDMPTCDIKKLNSRAILELNIDHGYLGEITTYHYGLVTALNMGYDIKNCILCKYQKTDSFGGERFCCLSKKFSTPTYPDQSEANRCQYFRLDIPLINRIKMELSDIAIEKIE